MPVTNQPAPRAEFDAYAASYDDTVNASIAFTGFDVDYVTRVKADYLLDLLRGHFGEMQALRLLDVGCGTGNCHRLLEPHVGALTGVDPSEACIAEAAARNPGVSYRPYDGERLPWADDSFDAAFTICVMHHVAPAQWPRFAAEMKRVIRPGGLAAVFEHNPLNPLTRRIVNKCEFDADRRAAAPGQGSRAARQGGLHRHVIARDPLYPEQWPRDAPNRPCAGPLAPWRTIFRSRGGMRSGQSPQLGTWLLRSGHVGARAMRFGVVGVLSGAIYAAVTATLVSVLGMAAGAREHRRILRLGPGKLPSATAPSHSVQTGR